VSLPRSRPCLLKVALLNTPATCDPPRERSDVSPFLSIGYPSGYRLDAADGVIDGKYFGSSIVSG